MIFQRASLDAAVRSVAAGASQRNQNKTEPAVFSTCPSDVLDFDVSRPGRPAERLQRPSLRRQSTPQSGSCGWYDFDSHRKRSKRQ
jgi:hypothetical protein